MTIKDILEDNKTKQTNKKLALVQVLNLSIPEIVLNKDKMLTNRQYRLYNKIIRKLEKNIPIQYITKKTYFYNKQFHINKNTLIPRPETEVLIDETQKLIEKHFKKSSINIIDIGTGSGIIAITLKNFNENYKITATDISRKALKIAKKNSKKHSVKITFKKANFYEGLKEKYNVIISNPPYIPNDSKDIQNIVKQNEPHIALFGGEDGLDCYRQILENITEILKENHIIAFEIGENQGQKIEKMIKAKLPKDIVHIKKDYNNYDRYIFAISPNTKINKINENKDYQKNKK